VSEFVPAILWEEATEAGHVWQRRFYDFVVFSESKRIQKLRYMAGWPTCPRVAFFNASESRAPPPIGIGGAVAHLPPSRPGELQPRAAHRTGRKPLDLSRLVPPIEDCRLPSRPAGSSCYQLAHYDPDAGDLLPSLPGG